MKSYNTFAKFYDELTDNVEYEKRSKYIYDFFKENCANCNSVLDLACGTGSVSEYLADMGMEVIGMDLSDEMLTEACLKVIKHAVFIKGDMTCFTLPQKVDCCICSLDSINHLKDIGEVRKCFDCVYNSLDNGGVFVFDVNTVYKHQCILADNTFVFDEEDFFLSWDNEYLGDNTVRILLDFLYLTVQAMTDTVKNLMKKLILLKNLKIFLINLKLSEFMMK